MFFFPWNTDAPIYYFPFATILLIVVNGIVFGCEFAQPDADAVLPWCLAFGDGLHPLQWLTNNFLHADLMHLLGNMVFLWSFGLLVEGKLGWQKFLPLYLAIGIVYGFCVQVVMLAAGPGVALGASGAIFGLMMICLFWAPRNEFNCILWWGMGARSFDVSVISFAMIYLVMQFVMAFFSGFSMDTPMLHLIGAAVGTVPAVVLLKRGLVDCEGWDLFAVWAGNEGVRPGDAAAAAARADYWKPKEKPQPTADAFLRLQEAEETIRAYLERGNPMAAWAIERATAKQHSDWSLPQPDLAKLTKQFLDQKNYQAAIPPMLQYVRRFPDQSAAMRLKLAQLLLVVEKRPFRALDILEKIDAAQLSPQQAQALDSLRREAERQSETADLEVESDDG